MTQTVVSIENYDDPPKVMTLTYENSMSCHKVMTNSLRVKNSYQKY